MRAADDFAAIRVRLEELERERQKASRKVDDELIRASRERTVEDWKTKVVSREPRRLG